MSSDADSEPHRHLWEFDRTLESLRERLENIDARDGELDELTAMVDDLDDAVTDQHVHVALLGDTNAGKSTLVNAVLGQRLLPSSSSGPGTAVVTTLRYRPGPTITVRIMFATGANLRRAAQELFDQIALVGDDDDLDLDVHDLIEATKRRLTRVFGESLDDYLATGHVSFLREVPEAAAIVAEGTRVVTATDAQDVHRTLLAHADAAAAIGYLVERVDITGDFAPLRSGVTLLDLPGLNDPDARRTEATRRAVADADVVWVVYPLDTGLGTSTIRAVQNTLSAHHLLLDRGATRLRFICTKNEAVAEDTAWRLGLGSDAGDAERRRARDRATRTDLADKLEVLLRPMERRLGALVTEAQRAVREAPIHLVSAHESLAADNGATTEPSEDDIGAIAPLAHELEAIGRRLVSVDALRALSENAQRVEVAFTTLGHGDDGIKRVATTPNALVDGVVSTLATALRETTVAFIDRVTEAGAQSFEDLDRLRASWESLHPQVFQAILLRRGYFTGQGGAHYDANADIAQSFFVAVQHEWVRYFHHDVPEIVEAALAELLNITGSRPFALARQSQRLEREVETDMLSSIVEAVREPLVAHYDRLVHESAKQTRSALAQSLIDAIEAEREAIRSGVVACTARWLSSVVDDLIDAARADGGTGSRAFPVP
jgi:Dynamin family